MSDSGRPSQTPVLATEGVSKSFGPVRALTEVSFQALPGRVVALVGDNGAGKTTLIKILSGVYRPTAGRLLMEGEEVRFNGAAEARTRGIATVFQDLAVCDLLSISRNIVLGNEPLLRIGPLKFYDRKAADQIAMDALGTLGVQLNAELSDYGATLSGGQRQALAIARAIHYGSRCLILDEPTASLAARQTQHVLDLIRRAAKDGQAVILVTHNFVHALKAADDVVALAHGRVVGRFLASEVSIPELVDLVSRV
jgi:simple sugar transport system ATP-binding protein